MADTYTTNLNLTKPEPGAAEDTWGISLNSDLDTLDAIFSSSGTQVNLNPNQVNFADNKKAIFGTGSDLEIYHDGSNSYIRDTGTGSLRITAQDFRVRNAANNASVITGLDGSGVFLYHNGSEKLATTSSGIDVTGRTTTDGLTTSASLISTSNSNSLGGTTFTSSISTVGLSSSAAITSTSNSNSLGGTSFTSNIDVTGTVTSDGLTVDGVARVNDSEFLIADNNTSNTAKISMDIDTTNGARIRSSINGTATIQPLGFYTGSTKRLNITSGGDISFYDDTGSTQGLFWDASAETLAIGHTNPSSTYRLDVAGGIRSTGTAPSYTLQESDASNQTWLMASYAGTFAVRDTTVAGSSYPLQIQAATPNNTLFLKSDGSVGIGTSSPSKILHLSDTSDNCQMMITSINTGTAGIIFGDSDDSATGHILYHHTDNALAFGGYNNSERMRIDSSGELLAGKTSADNTTAGHRLSPSGFVSHVRSGNEVMILNRLSSDGSILTFRKDGANVGSIRSRLGLVSTIVLDPRTNGAGLTGKSNGIEPTDESGTNTDGVLSLGSSTSRFADLHLSGTANVGGLKLGDNEFILAGTGSDLKIGHDGTNNIIRSQGPSLYINANNHIFTGYSPYTEHMRIDSSGNLLVGTTDTQIYDDSLDETGIVADGSIGQLQISTNNNTSLFLNRQNANGRIIDFRINGTRRGSIGTASDDLSINGGNNHSGIRFQATGLYPLYNENPANGTIDLGATGQKFQNLHLSDTAFIGNSSNTAGNRFVHVDGDADGVTTGYKVRTGVDGTGTSYHNAFVNPNGIVGTISTNGSATAYNTSSDARLKDVTGEARGLEVITKLNPVAYNWKADGKADEGLIAQEVKEIVPNAVSGSEDEHYQMDYSKLVTHLVAGMKEQQEQIESLKSEIAKLKGE